MIVTQKVELGPVLSGRPGRQHGRRQRVRCGRDTATSGERDMSDATDLVDRQIAAYRDRDLAGFLSFYAEDVKIRDFDGNILMDGQEGMRGMYGPLFRDSP